MNRVAHKLDGDVQRDLHEIVRRASDRSVGQDFYRAKDLILKIAYCRSCLVTALEHCRDAMTLRDYLLLDFSLESVQSATIQGCKKNDEDCASWMELLNSILKVWSVQNPHEQEWASISHDNQHLGLRASQTSTNKMDALLAKALVDRVTRRVGETTEIFQSKLGAPSVFLGSEVGIEPIKVNVFVDEVLRGSSLLAMSVCVKHLEAILRKRADLPPWQLISWVPKTQGELVSVKALTNIQTKVFETPTILICDAVNGEEEIPTGVQAVLVRSAAVAPDILSHVSVRARNAHVLLATCFDPNIIKRWEDEYQGSWVQVTVVHGGSSLEIKACDMDFVESRSSEASSTATQIENAAKILTRQISRQLTRQLSRQFDRDITQRHIEKLTSRSQLLKSKSLLAETPTIDLENASEEYVIAQAEFESALVGSKSMNLRRLQEKLDFVRTPCAFALPYGAFQKVLGATENKHLLSKLQDTLNRLTAFTENDEVTDVFTSVQELMQEIKKPETFVEELESKWAEIDEGSKFGDTSLQQLYAHSNSGKGGDSFWGSVIGVWASLFSMRPWVSLAKANRCFMDLNMAVLVQELIRADYAFVLHSKNPFGLQQQGRQMYGEIVLGLGEVLVGNYPGRALSWTFTEGENSQPEIIAFPSKSVALIPPFESLICRSDSNGEDLKGFAGAGLFESIPTHQPSTLHVAYSKVKLITDVNYRTEILKKISVLCFQIEDAFGAHMDVEGVVSNDQIVIVQARPQV